VSVACLLCHHHERWVARGWVGLTVSSVHAPTEAGRGLAISRDSEPVARDTAVQVYP
jgi:hypothetical protein